MLGLGKLPGDWVGKLVGKRQTLSVSPLLCCSIQRRRSCPEDPGTTKTICKRCWHFLLLQHKNTSCKYSELDKGCCGKSEVALFSFASFLKNYYYKRTFPSSELVIHIFSLKISSLWCLTIILVLTSWVSPPLSKGGVFPFYQELSYLFQSIHRLVAEKDILVEYIPLSDHRCIPSTVGFF